MEYASQHQRRSGSGRVIVVPNHYQQQHFLLDLGPVNPPPVAFLPVGVGVGSGVVNPSFGPQFVRVSSNPFLIRMDHETTLSLLQFMENEGIVACPEDDTRRRNVIHNLKQIVMQWIRRVAYQRRLPQQYVPSASATILTYGSYGLGVHNSESDIDALCVGPCFATMSDDFFIVLHNMLKSRPEVSELHCVKDAKVPLMRFKFDGISIDLPYAQLKVISVPENVDILNPFFTKNIDDTSWKCLSGVRANKSILQLVPNVEIFQSLLRCVKLWAKRRGVYGNLNGFFGGVHLAILAAFICQRHLNASFSALISSFFKTFAFWPWPTPVVLQDEVLPATHSAAETRSLMPIMLPCSPYEYCHSNITRSTFYRIRVEFLRGHAITKDLISPEFKWSKLFEPFLLLEKYSRFLKIRLSASDHDQLGDWVGWIKSRFRSLIVKMEEAQGFCDPNPTEYADVDVAEPNAVFYWGLQPSMSDLLDIESVEQDFMKNISNGYQGPRGKMALSIVQVPQLPKNVHSDIGNDKATKACWRILDSNQQMVPVYSRHRPHYFVGYLATNGNPVCLACV